MPRFRLLIEYDGTPFRGFQRQANGPSVQQTIEEAIHGFCGETVTLFGAGRTDTGVHARGQVAHVDLSKDWKPDNVRNAINAHMESSGAVILEAEQVPDTFDARFSAIRRHYLYRIINRRAPLTIDANTAWGVRKPLDVAAMDEAAKVLVGHHDFTTFRSTHCQAKSPMKTLDTLDVSRSGDLVEIRTSSRSFLHNQVRSFVGSLKQVGQGGWTKDDLRAALEARDRKACGPVAPSQGLYLMRVDYPDDATL